MLITKITDIVNLWDYEGNFFYDQFETLKDDPAVNKEYKVDLMWKALQDTLSHFQIKKVDRADIGELVLKISHHYLETDEGLEVAELDVSSVESIVLHQIFDIYEHYNRTAEKLLSDLVGNN